MEHVFLRNDKKLRRIESCDFFLEEKKEDQIKMGLKEIANPIMILFYYDSTSPEILSSFHRASRSDNLQKDEDLDFLFGCINLNYETDLYKLITSIDVGNPFKWLEMSITDELPMIAFYSRKVPQFKYFGELTERAVRREFIDWKKDFQTIDYQKTLPNQMEEGLFLALSGERKKDFEDKPVSWEKGETFRIRFLGKRVSMEKWSERREQDLSKVTEFTFSSEPDSRDGNKGDKIDETYVVENFRRLEKDASGSDRTLILDSDFFETQEGNNMKALFEEIGGK